MVYKIIFSLLLICPASVFGGIFPDSPWPTPIPLENKIFKLKDGQVVDLTEFTNQFVPAVGEKEDVKFDGWAIVGYKVLSLTGPSKDLIILVNGYEEDISEAGYFGYFRFENKKWNFIEGHLLGEYVSGFKMIDLTGSGADQAVFYSGLGMHGTTLRVYKFSNSDPGKSEFERIFSLDGYGNGSSIQLRDGKPVVVDYRDAVEDLCEACRISFEVPYRWDGKSFVKEINPFADCLDNYENYLNGPKDGSQQKTRLKKSLVCFEEFLKSHPDDFNATANCAVICGEILDLASEKKYLKELEDMDPAAGDSKYCDPEIHKQNVENRIRLISDLQQNSE